MRKKTRQLRPRSRGIGGIFRAVAGHWSAVYIRAVIPADRCGVASISDRRGYGFGIALRQPSMTSERRMSKCQRGEVEPGFLARQADPASAGLSGCQGARRGRGAACDLSAAGFRRRGAQSQEARWRKVAAGEAFLLQGGDCAESFAEHGANNIRDFFRLFLQMAVVLTYAAASPVVKVGRVAGQFAKPRTSPTEKRGGVELPVYRGDIINGTEFTPEARTPDPRRQLEAYRQSAATLNLLRAFAERRLRQSRQCASMDAGVRQGQPAIEALQRARRSHLPRRSASCAPAASILEVHPEMRTTDFFTSHEALLLGYEQAFTRVDSTTGDWYCTSGHMVWIGDRTRQADHAHVEFCRGIKNPLGLKTGPTQKPDELLKLIDILDPDNEPGRLTLICRVGADKAADLLPAHGARGQARGPQRGVVVRSDARQHHHLGHRLQDPAVRPDPQGGARLLSGSCRRGHLSPAACIWK